MRSSNNNQTQGFTIIEVMIVLVIAAVIILIVFLAVPALQRNSRNNQRKNDAARVLAAAKEWKINNNNENPIACISPGTGTGCGVQGEADRQELIAMVGNFAFYDEQTTFAVMMQSGGWSGLQASFQKANRIKISNWIYLALNAECDATQTDELQISAGNELVVWHGVETGTGVQTTCI